MIAGEYPMKLNREKSILLIQLFILILFLSLTLLNEEFDLPHHLLGDPPVSVQHRHGEIVIELSVFFIVVATFYMINRNLLLRIRRYEKQKEIMERIFYHDIHNTAVVLHGFARLFQKTGQDESRDYKKLLYRTSLQLIEEIEAQRDISYAEKDKLPVHPQSINSYDILTEVAEQYRNHVLARDRNIEFDAASDNVDLVSDKVIIKRVLGNMVKNALEASEAKETVRLGCFLRGNAVEFQVHNSTFIPPEIQKRIFQFSFSTKGKGRGLGTYSMKLLSEKFLKGKVSFDSSAEQGTTFKATFPLQHQ